MASAASPAPLAASPVAQHISRERTRTGRRRKPRLHQYDQIINFMLLDPSMTLGAIAREIGVTQPWLTQIIHTDAFKLLYEERRRERMEQMSNSIDDKLRSVAFDALDVISKRVRENPEAIPTTKLLEVADKSLERLGYGVKLPNAGTAIYAGQGSQVAVLTGPAAAFAQARDEIREKEQAALSNNTQNSHLKQVAAKEVPLNDLIDEAVIEGEVLVTDADAKNT